MTSILHFLRIPSNDWKSQLVELLALLILGSAFYGLYCLLSPAGAYAAYEVRPVTQSDFDRVAFDFGVIVSGVIATGASVFLSVLGVYRLSKWRRR